MANIPEGMHFSAEYSADDPNTLDITVSEETAQDYKDGLALRLLLEALPKEWRWGWMQRDVGKFTPADRQWVIGVMGPLGRMCDQGTLHTSSESRTGRGGTIAEAADKCREALG